MLLEAKKNHIGKVIDVKKVSKSLFYITFYSSPISIKAGQFISTLCDGLTLRRPFSVVSSNDNEIGILFKKKGKGTEFISNLKKGSKIDFIGPLGNGFNIKNKKALLVGAGVGTAPVLFLQNYLNNNGVENTLLAGFTTKDEIPEGFDFNNITTDDGSFGLKGSIINHVEDFIINFKPEIIYGCGPNIVLKKISEIAAKHNIETQIAMEKVMACGIGVCRGCVIQIKSPDGIKNATVCKDGPVFNSEVIIWE